MDDMQGLSLTEAAREAYMQLIMCDLPASSTEVEAWVPAMKAVSRMNTVARYPALIAIADQLEAGFHDAICSQDPHRLRSAFDDAARRLRPHTGAA
jgi:hypothetical protein